VRHAKKNSADKNLKVRDVTAESMQGKSGVAVFRIDTRKNGTNTT